tara:strand:- start:100 stop:1671 length:1572 start_codon:yes stop_codon:yes gene_type:complete
LSTTEDHVNVNDGFLLQALNIVKKFGDFAANDDVSLKVMPGEIHALLGENGAGKSTLVKVIYGSLQPTSGEIKWRNEQVTISNPAAARRLGVGMVFQHFSLFDSLSVAENIALAMTDREPLAQTAQRVATVSTQYGLLLEPDALVADLSVGQRQRVEIVRCLLQEPRLLIMDEPTAVLAPQEAEQLFSTLSRLADEGCAVLYISHRLEEVKRLCHNATILRHGEVVANVTPSEETAASLARLMVGSDVHAVTSARNGKAGTPMLNLRGVNLEADGPFGVPLRAVDLIVNRGEIVAIAGVAGNGQAELFDVISGERPLNSADAVVIDGQSCGRHNISARRRLGAAFVPEERLGHAAVSGMSLSENVILTRHASDDRLCRNGLLNRKESMALGDRIVSAYDVRTSKRNADTNSLSGGNLQKFVVGRELDREPGLVVINQPTWGVDAGAAALIRQALVDLARNQAAVLVISQDLDEIFEIADRIAVISRGQLSELYEAGSLGLTQIGLLMAGAHEQTSDDAALARG